MAKRHKEEKRPLQDSAGFAANLFADLDLPHPEPGAGPGDEAVPEPVTPAPADWRQTLAGAQPHVRIERKGRGGKTVTVIEHFPEGQAEALAALARELRRQFGVGGSVVDGAIELQGEQRQAVRKWLAAQGLQPKG